MKEFSTKEVIDHMLNNDRFSAWLGIELEKVSPGQCIISMTIREEMLNGFGIAHGGVTFALADTALAIASNSYNILSVALDASISYPNAVNEGDKITAKASQISLSRKTGVYGISVSNQHDQVVAFFKGTVYRTSKKLFP
ncbi:MAG: hydroxyphenylacetyl-CoA thioesterase PaaI [Cyclobacteriaceae bacterium]|nr:hydroxyphenylacetyl-CoA thioesterase PaaI [Cyclobacteriaceae bacterium]